MYYVLLYMYDIGASIARAVHAYTNHHYWNNSSVKLRNKRLAWPHPQAFLKPCLLLHVCRQGLGKRLANNHLCVARGRCLFRVRKRV